MSKLIPNKSKIEFGDFQTPDTLAVACCRAIVRDLGRFDAVVEPTCGTGAFVKAAASVIRPNEIYANEINQEYLELAKQNSIVASSKVNWTAQDFFRADWQAVREQLGDQRTLFLGNPPWVTNSQLGSLNSRNVPAKRNLDGVTGIQARTGHGNFDISESVLRVIVQAMCPGKDAFAFLVKTATARKLVRYAWKNGMHFAPLAFYEIDAKRDFGVSVDAVLAVGKLDTYPAPTTDTPLSCLSSQRLDSPPKTIAMGWVGHRIVSDPDKAQATLHVAKVQKGLWRSGVKHDASKVLELKREAGNLINGFGETVKLESEELYPLMKGADVANRRFPDGSKLVLMPQHHTAENTDTMAERLPLTFAYLEKHRATFAKRKSSIYRDRDRFAIFGVGPYTWRPWKVAICGLYKRLGFAICGPHEDRPVVFDDTVCFVAADNEAQSRLLLRILQSDLATAFLESRIFWDSKRPITVDLLQSLNLRAVASEIGVEREWAKTRIDNLFPVSQSVQADLT